MGQAQAWRESFASNVNVVCTPKGHNRGVYTPLMELEEQLF